MVVGAGGCQGGSGDVCGGGAIGDDGEVVLVLVWWLWPEEMVDFSRRWLISGGSGGWLLEQVVVGM